MENLSRETFFKGVTIMLSTVGLQKNSATLKAWYGLLNDIPEDRFLVAIEEICKTEVNIYPGTNIVALIRKKALCVEMTALPGEAWEEVRKKISSVGNYSIPEFSSKEIKKAVDAIGWETLCMSSVHDVTIRAHFMKIYESYRDRQEKMAVLPGRVIELVKGIGG